MMLGKSTEAAGAGRENRKPALIQSIIEKAAELGVDLEDSLMLAYSNEWKKYIAGQEKGAVFDPESALSSFELERLEYLNEVLGRIDLNADQKFGEFHARRHEKNGVFVFGVQTNLEDLKSYDLLLYFHYKGCIALAGLLRGLLSGKNYKKAAHFSKIRKSVNSVEFNFDAFKRKADAYADAKLALAASIEEDREREKKAALAELDAKKQLQTL